MSTAQPKAGDALAEVRRIAAGQRRKADGRVFAAKLALLCALVTAGMVLVLTGNPWCMAAGVVLCGLMYAHGVELQHEALHGIGFAGRRANTAAGILLGVPMLSSFSAYRASHMRHHRLLGTPENREFFDYGDQYGADTAGSLRRALSWFYRFSMLGHYLSFAATCGRLALGRSLPGEKPATVRAVRWECALMAALIAVVTAASVATGSFTAVWLWAVPLLVTNPVHALIELPEHYRCETDSLDVFRNTRTIRSSKFMAWYTNGNNFHVEHHFMPSLPISQLGTLHETLQGRHHHLHQNYRQFFVSLAKGTAR